MNDQLYYSADCFWLYLISFFIESIHCFVIYFYEDTKQNKTKNKTATNNKKPDKPNRKVVALFPFKPESSKGEKDWVRGSTYRHSYQPALFGENQGNCVSPQNRREEANWKNSKCVSLCYVSHSCSAGSPKSIIFKLVILVYWVLTNYQYLFWFS